MGSIVWLSGHGWIDGESRRRSTREADTHPREDRLALAGREPDRAWVRYRALDCRSAGGANPRRMGRRTEPSVRLSLAGGSRILAPAGPARCPRTKSRGDRRLAGNRADGELKEASREGRYRVVV